MIGAGDPARYDRMLRAAWVYGISGETLDKCIADMFQTRQEQQCTSPCP